MSMLILVRILESLGLASSVKQTKPLPFQCRARRDLISDKYDES